MSKTQKYNLDLAWEGNRGAGTMTYTAYDRDFVTNAKSKHIIAGSSHPAFRGSQDKYCPEELLLASLASCHMLWYLHMCAANGVVVLSYEDQPVMEMKIEEFGNGDIQSVTLYPVVRISSEDQQEQAIAMHDKANENCFIAKGVNFEIFVIPTILAE